MAKKKYSMNQRINYYKGLVQSLSRIQNVEVQSKRGEEKKNHESLLAGYEKGDKLIKNFNREYRFNGSFIKKAKKK